MHILAELNLTPIIRVRLFTADKDGGGIYAYSSRVEFTTHNQSEIVYNIAENGGGIHAVAKYS